jgi:hypothetical protein
VTLPYNALSNGNLAVYDIKTGNNWLERLITPAHRILVYRDESGKLTLIDEQPGSGDILNDLTGGVGGLANRVVLPVH